MTFGHISIYILSLIVCASLDEVSCVGTDSGGIGDPTEEQNVISQSVLLDTLDDGVVTTGAQLQVSTDMRTVGFQSISTDAVTGYRTIGQEGTDESDSGSSGVTSADVQDDTITIAETPDTEAAGNIGVVPVESPHRYQHISDIPRLKTGMWSIGNNSVPQSLSRGEWDNLLMMNDNPNRTAKEQNNSSWTTNYIELRKQQPQVGGAEASDYGKDAMVIIASCAGGAALMIATVAIVYAVRNKYDHDNLVDVSSRDTPHFTYGEWKLHRLFSLPEHDKSSKSRASRGTITNMNRIA